MADEEGWTFLNREKTWAKNRLVLSRESRRPESNELFLDVPLSIHERLGYCCDQPEKRCQELPEIDCEGALCKRQALALLRSERKTSDHLAAQSHGHVAQRADGAAQRECVGHRPRTRTASGVAVTLRRDGTRAGERHDGDWYHLFMSGKTIPNVPGILHPREPETYAVAVHEDGHTKMAAFKIPGPTATPVFMGRTHSARSST